MTEEQKEAMFRTSQIELYKSFNISRIHEPVLTKSKGEHSIRFAYITFRNIKHAEDALRALNVRSSYRFWMTYAACDCLCPKARKSLRDKMFFNRWLDCNPACEPDEVIWENLGVSDAIKPLRFCIIYLIFVILLIASLLGLLKTSAW